MKLFKTLSWLTLLTVAQGIFAAEPLNSENPWSREAPPVAKVMAGYVTLSNTGKAPQTIVNGSSPNFKRVEIHAMEHKDGMMRMYRLPELTIAQGQSVSLEPGGKHLMLIGPLQRLTAGAQFPVTLEFKDGSKQTITFTVKSGDKAEDHQHHHHHHH